MKIVTILGARPQFIKAAPVSKLLATSNVTEILVHTGQHYDYDMSQVFFDEMGISTPNINLGVGSGSHGHQTSRMLSGIEDVLINEKPDCLLVYGDTNSTLAGALAAVKLHIPVAHVEAGLRSFNRKMPEEHNRVLTDHCSDLLFCPTQTAIDNLSKEGITQGVHWVGDTMYDAVLHFSEIAQQRSTILTKLGLEPKQYSLATVHRPYNTDVPENLSSILSTFGEFGETIVFPVHPRTHKKINALDGFGNYADNIKMISPVGYLDMLMLEQNARLILTDSGGIQKEAYFFKVPCVTLRPETEWVETVEAGWNVLSGVSSKQILKAAGTFLNPSHKIGEHKKIYGTGNAAKQIWDILRRT